MAQITCFFNTSTSFDVALGGKSSKPLQMVNDLKILQIKQTDVVVKSVSVS